jgi:hypothetical protein
MNPRALLLLALASLPTTSKAEGPAQPPAEAQVAQEFKAATPRLFEEWKEWRQAHQKEMALGHWRARPYGLCPEHTHFEFLECSGRSPEGFVKIDVNKTTSILTPFVGHIYVLIAETCIGRSLVPAKGNNPQKSEFAAQISELAKSCIRKTYDECLAAGTKKAGTLWGVACTRGPKWIASYADTVDLVYRWTEGKWEFEDEVRREPKEVPEGPKIP